MKIETTNEAIDAGAGATFDQADTKAQEAITEVESDDYFGVCPKCGQSDGFRNVGADHWFYCSQHKTKWCFGSNLFGCWRDETESDWQEAHEFLLDFDDVAPVFNCAQLEQRKREASPSGTQTLTAEQPKKWEGACAENPNHPWGITLAESVADLEVGAPTGLSSSREPIADASSTVGSMVLIEYHFLIERQFDAVSLACGREVEVLRRQCQAAIAERRHESVLVREAMEELRKPAVYSLKFDGLKVFFSMSNHTCLVHGFAYPRNSGSPGNCDGGLFWG